MSQEIITLLKNKVTEKEMVLDYVCGRGDYQNIVLYNMPDTDEMVVTKNNPQIQQMLKDLSRELDVLSKELDAGLAHLSYASVKSVAAQNFEIAKQYDEYTDTLTKNIQEDWVDAYRLVYHLYLMINQANMLADDVDPDWEVVLSLSY